MRALLLLVLGTPLVLTPPVYSQTGGPTNVVLIMVDDVGLEPFAFFPDAFPDSAAQQNLYAAMPNVEAMALGGLICENAYSSPVCSPTRAATMTGRIPQHTGLGNVVRADTFLVNGIQQPNAVAELGVGAGNEQVLLPGLLSAAGVNTGLCGKVHLMLDAGETALDGLSGAGWNWLVDVGGFDWYAAAFRNLNQWPFPPVRGQPWGYYNWIRNKNGLIEDQLGDGVSITSHATTVQADDAIEFVAQAQEPFFLFLSFNAPHGPYHKPPQANIATPEFDQPFHGWAEYQSTGVIGQTIWTNYMAMLEDIDFNIGRLIASMPPSVYDNTLFIFVGDNGTPSEAIAVAARPLPLTEEDFGSHGHGKDVGPIYRRILGSGVDRFKRSIYQPGIHVPLLFFGKGVQNPGRRTQALIGVEDLFNTIAEVNGLDLATSLPANYEVDGVSFAPVLQDTADQFTHVRQGLLAQYFRPNGDPSDILPDGNQWPDNTFKHQSYLHFEPNVGLFKIVRFLTPAEDKFFKLADGKWDPAGEGCDPWELYPLPHGPDDDPVVRQAYLHAAFDMKLLVDP